MSAVMTAKIIENEPCVVHIQIAKTQDGVEEVITKKVSVEDYIKIINSSIIGDSKKRIGKLPIGYYDGKISSNGYSVIISMPAGICPLSYYNTTFLIPFPRLVFYFKVEEGRIFESYVYASVDEELTDESVLYHYPFGNVYQCGSICWGGNCFGGECDKMSSLNSVISLFYTSPTNDDLWKSSYVNKQ